MADKKTVLPQWMGKPIVDPAHHGDLEQRAAIHEFQHKLPRAQAEAKAYEEYTKDHRQRAMAHHKEGMDAANAVGNKEDAFKHWMLFDMHAKALGLDSVGPVAPEIQTHIDAEDKKHLYKFKAHKADLYALRDHEEEAKKSELELELDAIQDLKKGWPTPKENEENRKSHAVLSDLAEEKGREVEVPSKWQRGEPDTSSVVGQAYRDSHRDIHGTSQGNTEWVPSEFSALDPSGRTPIWTKKVSDQSKYTMYSLHPENASKTVSWWGGAGAVRGATNQPLGTFPSEAEARAAVDHHIAHIKSGKTHESWRPAEFKSKPKPSPYEQKFGEVQKSELELELEVIQDLKKGEGSTLPVSQLLVNDDSLRQATYNTVDGKGSRTQGPLSVWKLEDGRHLLIDGHHRLVQHLRDGATSVPHKVIGEGYTDYYATPKTPFQHKKSRFGGLERFAENKIIEQIPQQSPKPKKAPKIPGRDLVKSASEGKVCQWKLGERRCKLPGSRIVGGKRFCHNHENHWANRIPQKSEKMEPSAATMDGGVGIMKADEERKAAREADSKRRREEMEARHKAQNAKPARLATEEEKKNRMCSAKTHSGARATQGDCRAPVKYCHSTGSYCHAHAQARGLLPKDDTQKSELELELESIQALKKGLGYGYDSSQDRNSGDPLYGWWIAPNGELIEVPKSTAYDQEHYGEGGGAHAEQEPALREWAVRNKVPVALEAEKDDPSGMGASDVSWWAMENGFIRAVKGEGFEVHKPLSDSQRRAVASLWPHFEGGNIDVNRRGKVTSFPIEIGANPARKINEVHEHLGDTPQPAAPAPSTPAQKEQPAKQPADPAPEDHASHELPTCYRCKGTGIDSRHGGRCLPCRGRGKAAPQAIMKFNDETWTWEPADQATLDMLAKADSIRYPEAQPEPDNYERRTVEVNGKKLSVFLGENRKIEMNDDLRAYIRAQSGQETKDK